MKPHWMRTKNSFFLIAIFLLATITLSVQAEEADFFDPFEDPTLPGWEHSPGVSAADGVMRIAPGNFAIHAKGWEDVRIVAQLRWEGEGEFILGSRISSEGGYLLLVGREHVKAQHAQGEIVTELAGAAGIEVPYQEWFQLEILLQGTYQQVFINEVMVLEAEDPVHLPPGGILFETLGGVTLEIEHLAVYSEEAGNLVPEDEAHPPEGESATTEEGQSPSEITSESDLVWVRTGGPLGGLGYDIRMHPENPDILFVTDSFAGVFKSTDGGKNWFPVNEGITVRSGLSGDNIPIFSLTIDPINPDTIWAGTQNTRGLFKSEDGGISWINKVNGIEEQHGITFRGISIDPQNSQVIYAAAELSSPLWAGQEVVGREFDRTKGVVYKSTNGGDYWQAVWRGENLARYILIDPRNSNVLYISTGIFDREAANSDHTTNNPGGVGVLKSTDGGQTWSQINNGITNLYIGSLVMHPEDPDILLAGAANNAFRENGGVFLTTDGGQSWSRVLEYEAHSVEFSPSNPMIAYAGNPNMIYRSTDGGFTWKMVLPVEGWGAPGVEAGFPIDFEVDPRNPDRIFANNYGGGNFLSEDGGRTWEDASTGYTGAIVRVLAVSPTEPGVVYAGGRSGLFVSTNGGGKWEGLIYPEAQGLDWNAVAVDPVDPQHILGANNWTQSVSESNDGGLNWSLEYFPELFMSGGRVIVFAPTDPQIAYLGFGAFYSAGTFDDNIPSSGVYISRNGGDNWSAANDANTESANISDLAVHPTNPQVVFITSAASGLFKTIDSGKNWTKLGGLPGKVRPFSIAIGANNPDLILMGSEGQGMYRSSDGGQTWKQVFAGLPPEAAISTILFHPTKPDVAFCGDLFTGVYQSSDGGQTWVLMSNGLRTRTVTSLAISADGWHLYAGTEGEGVFRLDFNGQPPEAGESLMVGSSPEEETAEESEIAEKPDMGMEEEQPELLEEDLCDSYPGQQILIFGIAIGAGVAALGAVVIFAIAERKRKKISTD